MRTRRVSRVSATHQRWAAFAVAIGSLVLGGTLYGYHTNRWGPRPDLVAAGVWLSTMPEVVGSWVLVEKSELSRSVREQVQCTGYSIRRYIRRSDGARVDVALIAGPPGPIAVHTPEICYSSRAYEQRSDRQAVAMDAAGAEHTFWRVDFRTRNLLAEGLRVHYGWSNGGVWKASIAPRYEFAAGPPLYKLQLAAPLSPATNPDESDAGEEFLKELLDLEWLRRHLPSQFAG